MVRPKFDKLLESSDNYVIKFEYNGRSNHFTLGGHLANLREAHSEITQSYQHYQYELPSNNTCVKHLTNSTTTNEPSIISPITHIQENHNKRADL